MLIGHFIMTNLINSSIDACSGEERISGSARPIASGELYCAYIKFKLHTLKKKPSCLYTHLFANKCCIQSDFVKLLFFICIEFIFYWPLGLSNKIKYRHLWHIFFFVNKIYMTMMYIVVPEKKSHKNRPNFILYIISVTSITVGLYDTIMSPKLDHS